MKTILITGATDGIGLETATRLAAGGHHLLLHGRNPEKTKRVVNAMKLISGAGEIESYLADLSLMKNVEALAKAVLKGHTHIDVLINNAGILKTPNTITEDGLDIRFAVNALAPYLLTKRLLTIIKPSGRIINLSSAAQNPVDLAALAGKARLDDMPAYAQSKLAITMWSRDMAKELGTSGPIVVAVNPGSLLASKMVTEGFGIAGNDIGIGGDILVRAALSDEFAHASGTYYDNDEGRFADPHSDALDPKTSAAVVGAIKQLLA